MMRRLKKLGKKKEEENINCSLTYIWTEGPKK